LLHDCIRHNDNQRTPDNKQHQNIHEPMTYVNGSGGIEGNAIPSFPAALPDDAYLDPRKWVEDMPTAYSEGLPPPSVSRQSLWCPRHDEGDKFLTEQLRITSKDEYRHLLCYVT
jgi:hypothetical protein